ncbi:hypothetical protein R3W88_001761 [Solanum pinnatisectum]|uniref:NB-ARC domain-containing protein n=1 Tax=Solanum pinnatisectum TaxID=50273 RepID=A0AAV9MM02_9SOLN|nr:hypothetical protein R3W88_001761 [Solanum pinnatisectum]
MQLTGCNLLQSFYEKLESLRVILDKTWKVTVDLKVLIGLEAQISQLAYRAEDMVDLKSRKMMQDQHARGARELEVVSIVWMGGIAKTTLANKIYNDQFIMSQFEIRAKVTVVLTQIQIQTQL